MFMCLREGEREDGETEKERALNKDNPNRRKSVQERKKLLLTQDTRKHIIYCFQQIQNTKMYH